LGGYFAGEIGSGSQQEAQLEQQERAQIRREAENNASPAPWARPIDILGSNGGSGYGAGANGGGGGGAGYDPGPAPSYAPGQLGSGTYGILPSDEQVIAGVSLLPSAAADTGPAPVRSTIAAKGDSWARIARQEYGDERYALALARANGASSATLALGAEVILPDLAGANLKQGGAFIAADARERFDAAARANNPNFDSRHYPARVGGVNADGNASAVEPSLPVIEVQPRNAGGVTQAVSMGWREAFNNSNTIGQRLIYGGLALAGTPNMMLESMLFAPFNVVPAARDAGQYAARAGLQTDAAERNVDILRAVGTGAEAFSNTGAWLVGPRPQASIQSPSELAAVRATYRSEALNTSSLDPRVSFVGHGADGTTFIVPKGSSITFYSPRGADISNALGQQIEEGVNIAHLYKQTYSSGQSAPNPILSAIEDSSVSKNPVGSVIRVEQQTPLSQLMRENMGNCHWAACMSSTNPELLGTGYIYTTLGPIKK
jgi:hypothetical protein